MIKYIKRKLYENKEIKTAAEIIKNGGIVAFPTDTIWGFLCLPFEEKIIKNLCDLKKDREGKYFALNSTKKTAYKYFAFTNKEKEYTKLWPAPFTIISSPKNELKNKFNDKLKNENGKVSIRVPDFPPLLKLLKLIDGPVISTSANFTGEKTPTNFNAIKKEFKNESLLNFIANLENKNSHKKGSTIFEIKKDKEIKIYRQGEFKING